MKKLVSLLLIIITAATLSVTASADAIAPEFDIVELPETQKSTDVYKDDTVWIYAYVSNPDGAYHFYNDYGDYSTCKIFETGEVLPYKERVTILDNEVYDGERYCSVRGDNGEFYVKAEDLTTVEKSMPEKICEISDKKFSFTVVKEGYYLYEGPSFAYGKKGGAVTVGTELTFDRVFSDHNGARVWCYIKDGKYEGWANVNRYKDENWMYIADTVGKNCYFSPSLCLTGNAYVVGSGVSLLKRPINNSIFWQYKFFDDEEFTIDKKEAERYGYYELIPEIPVGTKLTFKEFCSWESSECISAFAKVTYKDVEGWVYISEYSSVNVAIGERGGYYVSGDDGIKAYSQPGNEMSDVIDVLPNDTLTETDYHCIMGKSGSESIWYGIEKEDKIIWIKAADRDAENYELMYGDYLAGNDILVNVINKDGAFLYKDQSMTEVAEKLSVNAVLFVLAQTEELVYTEHNGTRGWINREDVINLNFYDSVFGIEYTYTYGDYWDGVSFDQKEIEKAQGKIEPSELKEDVQAEELTEIKEDESAPEVATQKTETIQPTLKENKTILYCVIAAVCISLTAAVIIILIKKKKNS